MNIVFNFKKEKSPSLDGITAKSLQICWEFVGPLCLSVIKSLWAGRYTILPDAFSSYQVEI